MSFKHIRAYSDNLVKDREYKVLMTEVVNDRKSLELEKEKIRQRISQQSNLASDVSSSQIKDAVATIIHNIGFIDKRRLLLELVDRIDVDKSQMFARIRGYIPVFNSLDLNQNVTFSSIHRYSRLTQCRQINSF